MSNDGHNMHVTGEHPVSMQLHAAGAVKRNVLGRAAKEMGPDHNHGAHGLGGDVVTRAMVAAGLIDVDAEAAVVRNRSAQQAAFLAARDDESDAREAAAKKPTSGSVVVDLDRVPGAHREI